MRYEAPMMDRREFLASLAVLGAIGGITIEHPWGTAHVPGAAEESALHQVANVRAHMGGDRWLDIRVLDNFDLEVGEAVSVTDPWGQNRLGFVQSIEYPTRRA